jgi:hypothetical protein
MSTTAIESRNAQTVVSFTFMGPYKITHLRAEDAPRPRVFPLGIEGWVGQRQ